MAQLAQSFDPTSVEPQKPFEPLPRGDYDVMILDTRVKPTKANDGSMLEIDLEVQTGPHANRKLFDRITLENKNTQAVEIGQRQLSGLCHAVGYLQPLTDSDVLHGRSCVARVGIEKGEGQYQDKNKISAYSAKGAKAVPVSSRGAPAIAAAPAARKGMPWQK